VSPDEAPEAGGDAQGGCRAASDSNLAGVHIDIDPARCVFTLAEARAGIVIGYDVVVDTSVSGVVPGSQDAGGCDAADGSGLKPFESLSGSGQSYCLCDVGLCPVPRAAPITVAAGRYHHTFEWDGTSWSGPSDTGNPHGAAFPAGTYTLRVSAVGSHGPDGGTSSFTVAGTLPITLLP
jgi:hypothetical protein